MKQYSYSIFIILLFFIMLFFPQEVFQGASDGLLLWFQIVLPTLLPFMIASNLLIHTNSISFISRIFGPFLKKCFCISENGSFAILAGFLCGYPMGAKVTSDLVLTGKINKREGNYLLSFCNNTSPMFIVSYVVLQNLKNEKLIVPSIFILLSAPILCSFLFRFYYRCHNYKYNKHHKHYKNDVLSPLPPAQTQIRFGFDILDKCIMDSFETITKIGGYIILFSVILSLTKRFPWNHQNYQNSIIQQLLLPMLEITNGIPMILKNTSSFSTAYLLAMALTSFGGFCSVAQTKSMIQKSGLSITSYIIEKLITSLVTSLFALFYLKFIF